MVVLFGWSYFFAPTPPPVDPNANVASNANTAASPAAPAPAAPVTPETALASTPDTTPNRQITIKSPLYEVTLDSRGALATSWILLKNRSPKGEIALYADGSTDSDQKPLQLISNEALSRTPRAIPFRLSTPDQNVTNLINDRNYEVSTAEDTIILADGQQQQIDFTLTDASGVEVKKSFLFRADSYISDLGVTLRQNSQVVPDTKLLIGASIGDHEINHHTFYQIESEAVAAIEGDIHRHQGYYSFTYDANNNASLTVPGNVDWAGVSDINSCSIGIEIHNPGHELSYADFPEPQKILVKKTTLRNYDAAANGDGGAAPVPLPPPPGGEGQMTAEEGSEPRDSRDLGPAQPNYNTYVEPIPVRVGTGGASAPPPEVGPPAPLKPLTPLQPSTDSRPSR